MCLCLFLYGCFATDQFAYFIFRICTRILDSFLHFPFVFFKISYYSCFIAAMFALVLDSFMHILFAFFKTFKLLCSCNVPHFHELPSSVLQVLHLLLFHMHYMYKEIGLLQALISCVL